MADMKDLYCAPFDSEKYPVNVRLPPVEKLPDFKWKVCTLRGYHAPFWRFGEGGEAVVESQEPVDAGFPGVFGEQPVQNVLGIAFGLLGTLSTRKAMSAAELV